MKSFFKVFWEGLTQAIQQLSSHRLRTFLSLLGITIGIVCVISVLSAVSSLEYNIRSSFEQLGDDVIYVSKFNWGENPSDQWFKIMRRPEPDFDDYQAILRNVKTFERAAFSHFVGIKSPSYLSSSASGVAVVAVTYDYPYIFNLELQKGRFFTPSEQHYGSQQAILGYEVAEKIFGDNIDPIGKRIKLLGRKMQVLGVLEKEGTDLINPVNFDDVIIVPFLAAQTAADIEKHGSIMVKAAANVPLEQLKDDLTATLRKERHLKPVEEDNFALNQLSILSNFFDMFFGTLNLAGWLIGGFSLLVGGFSVANIMFVSVRERTSIIGIKKALGAKQYMILLEFLVESIILSILGGILGLLLVYLLTLVATQVSGFYFFLSQTSIIVGVGVSAVIGVLAGLIPAIMAARMDPVEAMRK